jgi:hypothetical protein
VIFWLLDELCVLRLARKVSTVCIQYLTVVPFWRSVASIVPEQVKALTGCLPCENALALIEGLWASDQAVLQSDGAAMLRMADCAVQLLCVDTPSPTPSRTRTCILTLTSMNAVAGTTMTSSVSVIVQSGRSAWVDVPTF